MGELQKEASLHEKTVQKVATDALEPKRRRRRRRLDETQVDVLRLHPELTRYLKRHHIHMKFVEVISETEIIIRNTPSL